MISWGCTPVEVPGTSEAEPCLAGQTVIQHRLASGGLTWPLSEPEFNPPNLASWWSWVLGCHLTHLAPYLAMLPSPRTWRLQLH